MYANAQFKNSGNDEGDVLNFFNNTLRNLVQKNSGNNTFSIISEDCHDKDYPVNMNTKTKLRLTHQGHTISQIEKGFIKIDLQLELYFETALPDVWATGKDGETLTHLQYIFVGFKDAVELISEVYFWVDGKLVDSYHQQDMIKESFAYNCIRPRDAKTSIAHSHSLWESVQSMSPYVAGVYIPLDKFSNGGKPVVNIDLTIPFTDQLALQAWRLYPNRILGEMEEEVKFALDGLVWCQVNPKSVGEVKRFWDYKATKEYNFPDVPITNHFTQIGQSAVIVKWAKPALHNTKARGDTIYFCHSSKLLDENGGAAAMHPVVEATVMSNKLKVEPNNCKVKVCRTNCAGLGIKEDINNALFELLNDPIIIPAQELTRHTFEEHATSSGFSSLSKSVPLRNATNITMMFPSHPSDCTVFKNIMYTGLKLVVNKKSYPETDFENTWDSRFIQYQLMANELDGTIEPTREYIESISRPLNHVKEQSILKAVGDPDDNARYLMCPFDNTSFGINFQLERGNAGYVFDGIDTGSHTVTIEFRGKPITSTGDNDPYLNPDLAVATNDGNLTSAVSVAHNTSTPPNPEMWVCSDTYWTWSIQDGVRYYQRGIPAGYD